MPVSEETASAPLDPVAIPRVLDGERVDRVVSMLCGTTRSEAAELVSSGGVRIGGRTVRTRSRRVAEGDVLEVDAGAVVPSKVPVADASVQVPIVHADADLIVVDKPAGVTVHPGAGRSSGTLLNGLLARFPDLAGVGDPERPGIVHRLDSGTSGLMAVARTPGAYVSLVDQLSSRTVDRRYLALAWGRFESPEGVVDAPVGRSGGDRTRMAVSARGREARTRYRVDHGYEDPLVTLVECRLETGRTHQIRVHLSAIGHPVVGDARYGGSRPAVPLKRPFLHAWRLGLDHPATGERLEFTSPLPTDLEEARELLR